MTFGCSWVTAGTLLWPLWCDGAAEGKGLRKPNEASGLRATARHRLPDCRVNAHTAHLPSGRTRRLRPAGMVTARRAPQGARVAFRDIGSLARR